jgi:cell division protein FtsB
MLKKAYWLFIFAVLIFVIFLPGYTKLQDLKQKNLEFEERIEQLKKENLTLEKRIERLQKDPATLEKVAREKMGVVRKGEVVYKINPVEEKK